MSFSGTVKDELAKQVPTTRHCAIAEIAAILQYSSAIKLDESICKAEEDGQLATFDDYSIRLQGENEALFRKCFTLLSKTYNIDKNKDINSDCFAANTSQQKEEHTKQSHSFEIKNQDIVYRILEMIKFPKNIDISQIELIRVNPILIKSMCCRRSFLRGVFLANGSMSNPEKSYHLEYVCQSMEQAAQVKEVIASFDVEAKIVVRKKYYVVYIKEGEGIVELLNVMGAHVALMNFENYRILKEMRNDINRRVNCEAANITKTVNAASKQIDDIIFIKDHYGFSKLTDALRSVAEARLDYPEATLKELGELLNPPVGKSGVNHRLKKLSEIAEKIRG